MTPDQPDPSADEAVVAEAAQAAEDRRVTLHTAKIGLIGGLLGALVGGFFSFGGTWLTLHNQAQRDDENQHRLAVGTARVMIEGFDNAVMRLCELGRKGTFLIVTPHLRPEVTMSDRVLVAGELTPLEAQRVAEGDQSMATWELVYTRNRKEIEAQGGRAARYPAKQQGVDSGVRKAMHARKALERTAEFNTKGRVVCDPDHGWTVTISH